MHNTRLWAARFLCAACAWWGAASATAAGELLSMPNSPGSVPSWLTVSGNYLYFFADDGITGRELWKIDAEHNLSQVADILPGYALGELRYPRDANGVLYFFVPAPYWNDTRLNLWAATGSPDATRSVAPDQPPFEVMSAKTFGRSIAFSAFTPEHGREYWIGDLDSGRVELFKEFGPGASDGTPAMEHFGVGDQLLLPVGVDAGNVVLFRTHGDPEDLELVTDETGEPINLLVFFDVVVIGETVYAMTHNRMWRTDLSLERWETISTTLHGYLPQLTRYGDALYFQGVDEAHGAELWVVPAGARESHLLKDIAPGASSSTPYGLRAARHGLVFNADDRVHGNELWASDGTTGGTRLLRDLLPGPAKSDPYQHFAYNGLVLFSCENDQFGEELWRTDGTEEGTFLLMDINPGPPDSEPYYLTEFDGKVYFSARREGYGEELWCTDGTAEGTRLAARINPALRNVLSSQPEFLTPWNGGVFFAATARGTGRELWFSDGTEQGTNCVLDLAPGTASSNPEELSLREGWLHFTAEQTPGERKAWRYDPESQRVEETAPETPPAHVLPEALRSAVERGVIREDADPDSYVELPECWLFAGATPQEGLELWRADKASGDIGLVMDILPGPASSQPDAFFALDHRALFRAYHVNFGAELWISDGTPEGTREFIILPPNPESSNPREIQRLNDLILWRYTESPHRDVLYTWNPRTDAFLMLLQRVAAEPLLDLRDFVVSEGRVFFTAHHPAFGVELWANNGEPGNGWLVKDILPNISHDPDTNSWR